MVSTPEISVEHLSREKDLKSYERLAVERPTTNIISHLQGIREARNAFNLSGGIVFENHANNFADGNEEVQQSLRNLLLSSKPQVSSSNAKPKDADQICVYKETDGTRSLCLVVEYKPYPRENNTPSLRFSCRV